MTEIPPVLRLITLGRVRCFRGDQELIDLPRQRVRCGLLIFLAIEKEATREALQNLFWCDRDDERGKGALKQTLYELRRSLGDDWLDVRGELLTTTNYITTDFAEFSEAVESGDYARAFAVYDGGFLQDYAPTRANEFQFWVERRRAQLARLHRRARREHINQLSIAGDLNGAIAAARRWVELEPLEDEAQHRLIQLLGESGERTDALSQYEVYEQRLHADSLEPLDETRELVARLRAATALKGNGFSGEAAALSPAERVDSGSSKAKQPVRLLATMSVVLLIGIAAWLIAARSNHRTSDRSVAVMPLLNLGGNPDDEYFGDGVSEALINELSNVRGIRVAARMSSFAFKEKKDATIRTVAEQLQVENVLEGSVQHDHSKVRIQIRLVEARTGYQRWSKVFDRPLTDIFAIQDEIADSVVKKLLDDFVVVAATGRKSSSTQSRPLNEVEVVHGRRTTPEAYDAYLRGRYIVAKRSRRDFKLAITHFDKAIALDSSYAPAWAALAETLALQAGYGLEPARERLARARAIALRAVALDSGNTLTHTALAFVDREAHNLPDARRGFEQALARDSTNVQAHQWLAVVFSLLGKQDLALHHIRVAYRLDPLSPIINRALGRHLYYDRRYSQAVVQLRRSLELDSTLVPALINLGEALVQLRDFDTGIREIERAATLSDRGSFALSRLAFAYARKGEIAQAKKVVDELIQRSEREYVVPGHIAAAYCAIGDYERAIRELERAYWEFATANEALAVDPIWDPMRNDKRFVRLVHTIQTSRRHP